MFLENKQTPSKTCLTLYKAEGLVSMADCGERMFMMADSLGPPLAPQWSFIVSL